MICEATVDSADKNWTGELALADRQELDDAVLEMLGISNPDERTALRSELYNEITKLYRQIRVAERKMQRHRSATARHGKVTPHSLAEEIWDELSQPPTGMTLLDFVPSGARREEVRLPAGAAKVVKRDLYRRDGIQVGSAFIELGDPVRSDFVKELMDRGVTGTIKIPRDPAICEKALSDYRSYVGQTTEQFADLASAYTADETLQERVVRELWKRVFRH